MGLKAALLLLLALTAAAVQAAELNCTEALECDEAACSADPNCACSGSEPAGIAIGDRPQIVYITFDDALTELHSNNFFNEIFDDELRNPNGCPIRGTFFLTHQSNDYTLVNKYYSEGHEIASHSVSHMNDQDYWKDLDVEGWRAEITDMREMLVKYAHVAKEDIVGIRAPFLEIGGDQQWTMMQEDGFLYDSSMPSLEYGYTNLENGRWPHSFDYRSTMDCVIPPCPTCSYPGIWSQPILDLEDAWTEANANTPDQGEPCSMLDSCDFNKDVIDEDAVYQMMEKNFLRSYNGKTRAPLGFFVHAAWFSGEDNAWRWTGFQRFINDMMNNYDDVWVVPVKSGIEYMKNPLPNEELEFYEEFGCSDLPIADCDAPRRCRYEDVELPGIDIPEIYMPSCDPCPKNYPWIGNPFGE